MVTIPEFKDKNELKKALEKAQNSDGYFVTLIPEESIVKEDKSLSREERVKRAIEAFENSLKP